MSKFFNDLKAALQEIIAYEQGKLDLRSEIIEISDPSKQAKTIKKNHTNPRSRKKAS